MRRPSPLNRFLSALRDELLTRILAEMAGHPDTTSVPGLGRAGKRRRATAAAPFRFDGRVEDAYTILCVLPGAPLDVCEAAYRALIKRAHPDRGGDSGVFRLLTAAIETLRKKNTR